MKEKKAFFKERSVAEIQRMVKEEAASQAGLVEKIASLRRDSEALCIPALTPQEYFLDGLSSNSASRRNLRDGNYLNIPQPYSIEDALKTREIPLELREKAFALLEDSPQESIFCLGYSFRPVAGANRQRIKIPLWAVAEGCRRDSYDQKVCRALPAGFNAGSSVESYEHLSSAVAVVKIPSSTRGVKPYKMRWESIAVCDSAEKRVLCWSTRPFFERVNPHDLYNFGFRTEADYAYPHWIHAHQAVVRHYMKQHNFIPLQMSQYAILSREGAEFYFRLCNNVVVRDFSAGEKLRKLHIDEASMLLARLVSVRGPRNILYWDAERDGRIRDYEWEIKE